MFLKVDFMVRKFLIISKSNIYMYIYLLLTYILEKPKKFPLCQEKHYIKHC